MEFYVDTKGVQWWVWNPRAMTWNAQPVKDAYGVKGGKGTRAVVSGSDKPMVLDAIEDFVKEKAMAAPKTTGQVCFPWWFFVVGYLLLKRKGR